MTAMIQNFADARRHAQQHHARRHEAAETSFTDPS
jgi:hypothetical protein